MPDGSSFTLTFQRPGQIENAAIYDRGEELVLFYLGDPDDDSVIPHPFPPMLDGTIIQPSKTALRSAASMEMMQPDGITERYDAEAFVAMQRGLPKAVWAQVTAFVGEVRKEAKAVPKGSGADTETSSEPA